MCPHGAPDDSDVLKYGLSYRLEDFAELAVRLGSPYDYHRFGEVIMMDTFKDGLNRCSATAWGVGGYASLSNDGALFDGLSLMLRTGADPNNYAAASWYTAFPFSYSYGFLARVSFGVQGCKIGLRILFYTGISYAEFWLIYNYTLNTLSIVLSDGSELVIDNNLKLYHAVKMFHSYKLVVDCNKIMYMKALVNNHSYNISGYAGKTGTATLGPYMLTQVFGYGLDSSSSDYYVDGVVLTQNDIWEGM